MPNLAPYTVIYTEADSIYWLSFNCMAEDTEHAEEQCDNYCPTGRIIWVNTGHDNMAMD